MDLGFIADAVTEIGFAPRISGRAGSDQGSDSDSSSNHEDPILLFNLREAGTERTESVDTIPRSKLPQDFSPYPNHPDQKGCGAVGIVLNAERASKQWMVFRRNAEVQKHPRLGIELFRKPFEDEEIKILGQVDDALNGGSKEFRFRLAPAGSDRHQALTTLAFTLDTAAIALRVSTINLACLPTKS